MDSSRKVSGAGNQVNGGFQAPRRGTITDTFQKFINRYVFSSEELTEMSQFNDDLIYTQVLTLSTAQPISNPLIVPVPGRCVIIYGVTTATLYDPETSPNNVETVVNTVTAGCFFNDRPATKNNMFVLKHGRGYRGDFRSLKLCWPAQANNSARLVIFKFDDYPLVCGDVPA